MAAVTKLPALNYVQLSNSTTPVFRLLEDINSTTTTIRLNGNPVDESGSALTSEVYYLTTVNASGQTETMKVTATSGNTLTVVRGIRRGGLDIDTGISGEAYSHDSNQVVVAGIHPSFHEMFSSVLQGIIATGGLSIKVGDETDSDIYIYAQNADANKPYIRYDAGTSQWFYSDDGTTDIPLGGAGSLIAGDGIDITTGTVSVDLADTTTFVGTSSGAGDSGKVPKLDGSGQLVNGFIPNNYTAKGDLEVGTGAGASVYFNIGTDGQVLEADSTQSGGIVWADNIGKVAYGSFYRTSPSGSGTEVITGVGFTPKLIKITTFQSCETSGNPVLYSTSGSATGTGAESGIGGYTGPSTGGSTSLSTTKIIPDSGGLTDYYYGDISAISTDGFTINFTLVGTTGLIRVQYECFG